MSTFLPGSHFPVSMARYRTLHVWSSKYKSWTEPISPSRVSIVLPISRLALFMAASRLINEHVGSQDDVAAKLLSGGRHHAGVRFEHDLQIRDVLRRAIQPGRPDPGHNGHYLKPLRPLAESGWTYSLSARRVVGVGGQTALAGIGIHVLVTLLPIRCSDMSYTHVFYFRDIELLPE